MKSIEVFRFIFAHQVGKKDAGPLQHADQVHALAGEILGDLVRHFAHALLNRRAPNQYLQLLAFRHHRHVRSTYNKKARTLTHGLTIDKNLWILELGQFPITRPYVRFPTNDFFLALLRR